MDYICLILPIVNGLYRRKYELQNCAPYDEDVIEKGRNVNKYEIGMLNGVGERTQ